VIYTLPDLITNMRDEITARAEIYARRVSFGRMDQERANERLAFLDCVLKVLVAADLFKIGIDQATVPPPAQERAPKLEPLISESQRTSLRALIQELKDVGVDYPAMIDLMFVITRKRSRSELTSAEAAKVIHSFQMRLEEEQATRARLESRTAETPHQGVPF
jgi:hypothetical protein